jgi:WD40 repeat protein
MTCNVSLVVVRTLTGHRSNCTSVDFHPFGEFFASGSLDTNLKIWDIRKKGCIHTYKGHTRGVNAIRFTPDGRWVVSGGEDNTVKVRVTFFFYDIKYIYALLYYLVAESHMLTESPFNNM